jgi:hypothetical protein
MTMAVAETQDDDRIYIQSQQCEELFARYLARERMYRAEVYSSQQRFLTWTSFLGVFSEPSACLDHRLQLAPEMKELVLAMLRLLKINLDRGPHISVLTAVGGYGSFSYE